MRNDIDNHMTQHEDLPTLGELDAALHIQTEKLSRLLEIADKLESMLIDANRFDLDDSRVRLFFQYILEELSNCESERETLGNEIGRMVKKKRN